MIPDWLLGPGPITLLVDGHVTHKCVSARAVIMWHLWETAAGHIYSAAIKTHGKVTEGQSLDVRLHIEIVSNIKTLI